MRDKIIYPSKWQRVLLLTVTGYEGAGALSGGCLLIIAPDGKLMDMPVELMHGVFPDFLVPGIILLGLGILTSVAFLAVLVRNRYDWILSNLAMFGLAIWFTTEIIILWEFHWLHAMWGIPVIAGCMASLPMALRHRQNTRY